MPFTPLVALGTIVFCLINFLKAARVGDWSSVTTQLAAWVAGVVGVVLAAHTDFAHGIAFGDFTLNNVNGPSQVFLGLVASSALGVVTELKKAIDNTDSAAQPPLLPPAVPPNP